MIESIVPYAAVGVVEPASTCREVELRAVHFFIHTGSIANGVCLIDQRERFLCAIESDGQRLALVGRHVLEYPILGIGREASHDTEVIHALRLKMQATSRLLLRDGQVQILALHLEAQFGSLNH